MLDIARMAIQVCDWQTEFSAKHSARKFGNEFLGSVSCRTKSILEIAVEATGMAGPMRQLVRERRVIVVEAREEMRGRHCHPVSHWLIIGFVALMPQHGRNTGKE